MHLKQAYQSKLRTFHPDRNPDDAEAAEKYCGAAEAENANRLRSNDVAA